MSGLVELAERVERYAPSGHYEVDRAHRRELNEAIAIAKGLPRTVKIGDPALGNDRVVPHTIPDFVGSLDAAMSLVPNDAFWRVGHHGEGGDPSLFLATVFSPQFNRASRPHDAVADTAALALTAAALRARGEVLGRAYSVEGGVES